MKITNKNNLPNVIYNAIKKGWYNEYNEPNHFSVTTLLKPNKIYWLEKRYQDNLTEDATDRIWALMGSAMHSVLEKGGEEDAMQECRLFMDMENGTLHGSFDHYKDGVVSDFKFTSVWSVVYQEDKIEDWTNQLNLYALLLSNAGFKITKLQIVAILRDWSKSRAKFERGYPKKQVVIIDIPLWSISKQTLFANVFIDKKRKDENTDVDNIPECTPEQRWQSKTIYAVKRVGRKSAIKLHDAIEDAQAQIEELKIKNKTNKYYLDTRQSIPKRCLDYCPVSKYCNWFVDSEFNKQFK